LKLLADENFDNTILRGLLRRQPDIDIIRVQDTELYGANDPTVLAWAAQENRILMNALLKSNRCLE
jgi:predicted nuclease of predicted toxin-antitoxin system